MSQFGLPDPNAKILQERIEWESISNRNAFLGSVLENEAHPIIGWLITRFV